MPEIGSEVSALLFNQGKPHGFDGPVGWSSWKIRPETLSPEEIRMRVLIVEDDERILGFLKRGLEAEGYEVETAPTGEIGLDRVRTRSYDVILLDVYLPGISGLDLCRELRQQGSTTPVLIMTARDAPAVQDEGRRAGANDYLPKPFSFELLLEKMEALHPCGGRSG